MIIQVGPKQRHLVSAFKTHPERNETGNVIAWNAHVPDSEAALDERHKRWVWARGETILLNKPTKRELGGTKPPDQAPKCQGRAKFPVYLDGVPMEGVKLFRPCEGKPGHPGKCYAKPLKEVR